WWQCGAGPRRRARRTGRRVRTGRPRVRARGGCGSRRGRPAREAPPTRAGTGPRTRTSRTARGTRASHLRLFLEPEEPAHVAVVLGLAELGAEVQPQLVNDLDAQVAEPQRPARGADVAVDALADLVGDRRGGELAGPLALHAPRPQAAEPG